MQKHFKHERILKIPQTVEKKMSSDFFYVNFKMRFPHDCAVIIRLGTKKWRMQIRKIPVFVIIVKLQFIQSLGLQMNALEAIQERDCTEMSRKAPEKNVTWIKVYTQAQWAVWHSVKFRAYRRVRSSPNFCIKAFHFAPSIISSFC